MLLAAIRSNVCRGGVMSRTLMLVLWAWLLAACASNPKSESELNENRMGSDIPLVLQRAMVDGYALPTPNDCTGLLSDMQVLDEVLGEDIDSRGGEPVDEDFFASVMVSAVKGLIPYRSWLIRLSGEGKRERRGLAAIAAGSIRRAYLKGLGESWGCPLPGRPKRPPVAGQAED